ncbi:MAG: hypothetical protein CMM07_11255 [Rhodopirellula sp.]|nr:hypothetical protein [Rhodopirellula sp.]
MVQDSNLKRGVYETTQHELFLAVLTSFKVAATRTTASKTRNCGPIGCDPQTATKCTSIKKLLGFFASLPCVNFPPAKRSLASFFMAQPSVISVALSDGGYPRTGLPCV